MVGEDFFSPCDDGVHDVVVFGDLACGVEVGEPSEGPVGAVEVVGFVQLVELLERFPSGAEPWMSFEQAIQMLLMPVCEMIRPPEESEPGSEQVRFVCWGPLLWGAALQFTAYQGQAFGEPVGSDRGAVPMFLSVGFPGPRLRTGRAAFTASGSPRVGWC